MKRILHIDCSPAGTPSVSRLASRQIVERLGRLHPDATILRRDLGADPPPHVDGSFVAATLMAAEQRGPDEHAALTLSEALIGELEATDALVIGTPMHNYTAPSCLKAWIDHVIRSRRTFGFGAEGKIGLLADRPTYIVTAAGGFHLGANQQPDFLTPYLRAALATIGIRDVHILSLEGTRRGDDPTPALLAIATSWAAGLA